MSAPSEPPALGRRFESEIAEQPALWRALADGPVAGAFAAALHGASEVVFVGSGSSLFVAMLGALALRRRGVRAVAIPASEARFERPLGVAARLVALSQSGRSRDVLDAVEHLGAARVVAVTNDVDSPLAARAAVVVDVAAGPERAVPATKSVTGMVAILLWAAALLAPRAGGAPDRDRDALRAVAEVVERWLREPAARDAVRDAAREIAEARSVAVVGAGYGAAVALELALKIKESTYVHAEGFGAGEFRHGSAAILDARTALVGIVDEASRRLVERPLAEAERTRAARFTIGARVDGVAALGVLAAPPFDTLAWLVTGQRLALEIGRARGIDGDAPRGLTKYVG